MDPLDVYKQYFEAECDANGVPRRAVQAALVAESRDRRIRYYVSLSFFPHEDPEDFRITYDAYFERNVYDASGRRSKKREAEIMASVDGLMLTAEAGSTGEGMLMSVKERNEWMILDDQCFTFEHMSRVYSILDLLKVA